MRGRAPLILVAALFLGMGLAAGSWLAPRVDPGAGAASAAAPPWAPTARPLSPPGGDFSGIARRATPAVVNISALQVYRTERSPFFSDPFFRDFFGRDMPFRMPQEERKTSLGSELRFTLLRQGRRVTLRVPVEERRPDA